MQKLVLKNHPIPYSVRVSRRAKRMRLAVYSDSSVVLTLPRGFNFRLAEKFVANKFSWIIKSLEYFRLYKDRPILKSGKREYHKFRTQALALAQSKAAQWNRLYNFNINRINIKNQKTRWASCSKKGNLNFNYKIVHLPEKLVDYLVVHELCHLKEFNHSKNFWALVAQAIPDYKAMRQELKNFRMNL